MKINPRVVVFIVVLMSVMAFNLAAGDTRFKDCDVACESGRVSACCKSHGMVAGYCNFMRLSSDAYCVS